MDVEQFRGLPDQENGPRRASILRHDAGSFFVPVSINNKSASYLFDTGAWVSVMTESEATRHGLQIRQGGGGHLGSLTERSEEPLRRCS
jgi:predicted aspartyl protease